MGRYRHQTSKVPGSGIRQAPPINIWLALVAGCLLPFSLAPFDSWICALVSMAGLYLLLGVDRQQVNSSTAFKIGWLFGLGKYAVGASWIYVSIHEHGNAAPWLAALLVAVFVASMALFEGLWAWLYIKYCKLPPGSALNPVVFASSRVGIEWLLTWIFTGFPWLFVAYSQIDGPLAPLIPVVGVLGTGFALVICAVYLVRMLLQEYLVQRLKNLALAILPWLLASVLASQVWVERGQEYSVALVQGNVDQSTKWLPESTPVIIDNYRTLSEPYWDVDLMVWPEAAVTVFHHQAGTFLRQLESKLAGTLVMGIPAIEVSENGLPVFQNTAIAVGQGEGRYVKRHLVPFGEYVPFESILRGLIQFFDLPMSHAESGNNYQPLLRAPEFEMSMAICYEIAYPALVRREGARADVLLTISNDTWFGNSIGPHQHMQMARMRALELGRYLLRATNNGITAIVNEKGQLVNVLPQFEAGVLKGSFFVSRGTTPYGDYGDKPILLMAFFLLVVGSVFKFRDKKLSA
ncbi:MAG: apolipoprotein N-acyltransferase [Pseudomonadales bacterium]|nr:apolipoprotein N-acyltransferase [Pseudomonadales bacterium]